MRPIYFGLSVTVIKGFRRIIFKSANQTTFTNVKQDNGSRENTAVEPGA